MQIPFVLETKVVPLAPANGSHVRQTPYPSEKIVIEKVQVNPKFEASLFSRPVIETTASAKKN